MRNALTHRAGLVHLARVSIATRIRNLFVIHSHSSKLTIQTSVQAYTHARPFTRDTRVAVVRHVTQSLWLLEIQFAFSMVATHARDTSLNFFCLAFSFLFFYLYLFCARMYVCFHLIADVMILLIFLVTLRGKGDIKVTLLIERV